MDFFHSKGIKVILWATSMIDTDSSNYQEAYDNGYFIRYGLHFGVSWWKLSLLLLSTSQRSSRQASSLLMVAWKGRSAGLHQPWGRGVVAPADGQGQERGYCVKYHIHSYACRHHHSIRFHWKKVQSSHTLNCWTQSKSLSAYSRPEKKYLWSQLRIFVSK